MGVAEPNPSHPKTSKNSVIDNFFPSVISFSITSTKIALYTNTYDPSGVSAVPMMDSSKPSIANIPMSSVIFMG